MTKPEGEAPTLFDLGDGVYAVRFRYHMVTGMTMSQALPSDFMRDMAHRRLQAKFAEEAKDEAGTKRADSAVMRKLFPAEVALLEGQVQRLGEYVIFKLEPAPHA